MADHRTILNRIAAAMYEAFHEADNSVPWNDLPDHRRWFYRRMAIDGLIEAVAICEEMESESDADDESAMDLVQQLGRRSRTVRVMTGANSA